MKHRDLNAPPKQSMAEIVKALRDKSESSKTGAHGVKHMGVYGDLTWGRGTDVVSIRDIDGDLQDAQSRIDEAESDLADTQVRLNDAETTVGQVQDGLDRVENTTIPDAVSALEQADANARDTINSLETQLGELDGLPGDVSGIRDALQDAQDAVAAAQDTANTANQAANAASQAALEAAGIAESKGRVIVSETEPTGEDRSTSNIWIQPVEDDPDTEVEEKAVTYVYLEASDEWQPTTSSELAQAAQNALDAREAAQQAQQRADTAISNAAAAQSAAEDAQRTADQATLDAANAWNEAVAAGEAAGEAYDEAVSKLDQGEVEAIVNASANGKNSITRSADEPTGPGVVEGDTWWRVDPDGHVFGQWTWDGDTWVPTLIDSEVIASLDVGKLRVHGSATMDEAVIDKLWVDGIAGKTATFNSLTVAPENMVPDPGFADEAMNTRRLDAANGYGGASFSIDSGILAVETDGTAAGGPNISLSGNDDLYAWSAYPAMRIVATTQARVVSGTGRATMTLRYELRDGTRSSAFLEGGYQDATSEWQTFSWNYEFPQDIKAFTLTLQVNRNDTGVVEFRSPFVAAAVSSVSIEDGAVTAPKITFTEELSGEVARFMSTESKKLVVSEEAILNHTTLIGQTVVDDINVQGKLIGEDGVFTGTVDFANVNVTGTQIANKIEANQLSATQIDGDTFQGNTFTGGTFNGSSFIGGVYSTSNYASTDGGVHISPSQGLRVWNTSGVQTVDLSPSTGRLKISDTLIASDYSNDSGVQLWPRTTHGTGGIWFSDDGTAGGNQAAIYRNNYSTARDQLILRGGNGGGISVFGTSMFNDRVELSPHVGDFHHMNAPTSSSGANALIATSPRGRLYRSTSSRRYKRNIVEWNPDASRVLALQPRQWQHDDPSHPEDIDETWHVGFVAEEVDALGLNHLVKYMGDGKGGWIPDGLNYDRFAAAHQVVLKDHEARIADLESENADLRARLDTLEQKVN